MAPLRTRKQAFSLLSPPGERRSVEQGHGDPTRDRPLGPSKDRGEIGFVDSPDHDQVDVRQAHILAASDGSDDHREIDAVGDRRKRSAKDVGHAERTDHQVDNVFAGVRLPIGPIEHPVPAQYAGQQAAIDEARELTLNLRRSIARDSDDLANVMGPSGFAEQQAKNRLPGLTEQSIAGRKRGEDESDAQCWKRTQIVYVSNIGHSDMPFLGAFASRGGSRRGGLNRHLVGT